MAEPTDAQLMGRVQTGDRQAFAVLIDRHKDAMVNYLLRLTGSRERAEDAAQEAFLRLYRGASGYREEGKFTSYLYRIATNLVRSEDRRERRRRFLAPFVSSNGHQPAAAAQDLLRKELKHQVALALRRLPLRYRLPLVLADIEGWSYQAIAELLGCREGTIKSRIHRARHRLRQELEPYWLGNAQ